MKRPGRPHAGGNGTACGIPPEESRPAEGKAGGKEKRPAEKESQLAGAAPRREEQKKHCGKIKTFGFFHNADYYGIHLTPYTLQNNLLFRNDNSENEYI